jgi:tripartite-type tricarboxylate transporter receptor subunit TctC
MKSPNPTRPIRLVAAVVAVAALSTVPAFPQSPAQWPERPVRLLVPVGAGGAADTLSRNLSNGFPQFANGQPLIVENRPGAGGTIAAAPVAREKPDGYTLFLAEVGPNAVSHTLGAKLTYDPHTAFTPIIHAANLPAVVLIRPTLAYKTLAEFVVAAKQQPGKFTYASAGLGNCLNSLAGIDQINVPYRSGAEMLTALLRNDADSATITLSTALGQIKESKVRALAGTSMRPMLQLPDTLRCEPIVVSFPGREREPDRRAVAVDRESCWSVRPATDPWTAACFGRCMRRVDARARWTCENLVLVDSVTESHNHRAHTVLLMSC